MIGKEVIRVTRGKNLAEVVKEVTSILNFNGEKGEEGASGIKTFP